MTTYERVTYKTGDTPRTVILKNVQEGSGILRGHQCNQFGDEPMVEKIHIIETSLVKKRVPLEMHPKYAELRPTDKEIQK